MMNSAKNEIKNSVEGVNSRITETEEQISEMQDKIVEITTTEQNKEKRTKRIEDSLRDLWDNIKRINIQIVGVPEEQEKKKGTEKIFEELQLKTSLIWERKETIKSRKYRVPYRINPRRNTPRHINQTIKN